MPPGWLSGLVTHLGDAEVGVVGPDDESLWRRRADPTGYATYEEMLDFARVRRHGMPGEPAVDIDVAEMFCAAIRREVFEAVGPLDERFEIGMFEDDDYMRRVRDAGYRVVCANDLFVHHFGEASLGELAGDGRYGELFHANRRRFEEKWGVAWEPHGRRNDPEYAALAGRVTDAVREHVPSGANGAGRQPGRRRARRPRSITGPGTSRSSTTAPMPATTRPTTRRRSPSSSGCASAGPKYLVLPATALWWLDHYERFRRHLEDRYRVLDADDPETARIYRLEPSARRTGSARST